MEYIHASITIMRNLSLLIRPDTNWNKLISSGPSMKNNFDLVSVIGKRKELTAMVSRTFWRIHGSKFQIKVATWSFSKLCKQVNFILSSSAEPFVELDCRAPIWSEALTCSWTKVISPCRAWAVQGSSSWEEVFSLSSFSFKSPPSSAWLKHWTPWSSN